MSQHNITSFCPMHQDLFIKAYVYEFFVHLFIITRSYSPESTLGDLVVMEI